MTRCSIISIARRRGAATGPRSARSPSTIASSSSAWRQKHNQPLSRIEDFKQLIYAAAWRSRGGKPYFGILVDERFGRAVLEESGDRNHWVARPMELPENTPLVFEGGRDPAVIMREWPIGHTAKCLVYWHPDDPPAIADAQRRQIAMLDEACRAADRELLLEIITDKKNPGDARAVTAIMGEIYKLGVKPDWWKLAAPNDAAGWALLDGDDPRGRSLVPGRAAAGPRCARSRSDPPAHRRRRAADLQGLCRGPQYLRSGGGSLACRQMNDEAAVNQHRRLLRPPDRSLAASAPCA